jgi:hypothetical protein
VIVACVIAGAFLWLCDLLWKEVVPIIIGQ